MHRAVGLVELVRKAAELGSRAKTLGLGDCPETGIAQSKSPWSRVRGANTEAFIINFGRRDFPR
jgi:hypothetical protein